MLKKIWRLFLGLVVCMGSACVTPTHASSASSVVLTHIQAASPTSPKDEMVSIYNNSPNEINISNWCLKNKSHISFACFETGDSELAYYLPAYSFAVVATESFLAANAIAPEIVTVIFTVTNQSSGSLVNSNDIVSLTDTTGQVIDSFSWTTVIASGKLATRIKSVVDPRMYETADSLMSWIYTPLAQMPISQVEVREAVTNEPPEEEPHPTPEEEHPVIEHPVITELLPDAEGSDTGNEFIELYNPTSSTVDLNQYKLRIGPNLEKVFSFPIDSVIASQGYGIYTNSQINFSLLNTSSSVQLEYNGQVIGEVVTYTSPKTGESWALIDGTWQYTNMPTFGVMNLISVINTEDDSEESDTTPKPCAANQYRSPETNRCRLIATTASTQTPCKAGQERNAETNRCRNIATTSEPAPCKEGQERNLETNRCRNSVKMTNADYGIKGASTEQTPTNWYLWLGIAVIVVLILGYAVWEWREELKKLLGVVRQKFARSK